MFTFGYAIALALSIQGDALKTLDMTVGKGAEAAAGDRITVDYTGNLLDGKVFDSSVGKPPFTFSLGAGEVIKGWDDGFAGMKVGGRRILSIPSTMGYGDKGVEGIPGKSTLVFEVKLLRVDKKDDKPALDIAEVAPGTGFAAKAGDKVSVHYTGKFLNGTVFDSSYPRKEPIEFTLGAKGLIAGFDKGATGMKVGGKRTVTIPYQMAYGPNWRPPVIPAFATLVFELELMKIEAPAPPKPPKN